MLRLRKTRIAVIRTVDKIEERTLEALLLDVARVDTVVDAADTAVE